MLKAPNGDTLKELNQSKLEAEERLTLARIRLRVEREKLGPLEEAVNRAELEMLNLSCRIKTWHHYHGNKPISPS